MNVDYEKFIRSTFTPYTPKSLCGLLFSANINRYLLIDSKARKVIVAEDTLLPYRIKEAICRVLFTYFQAPSVTFLSSHVLALASTGLRTAVVVDIGWHDTRILPVLSSSSFHLYANVFRSMNFDHSILSYKQVQLLAKHYILVLNTSSQTTQSHKYPLSHSTQSKISL